MHCRCFDCSAGVHVCVMCASVYVYAGAHITALTIHFLILYRWKVVTSCWSRRPKERPRFASLVNTVADLLDSDPTYIKLIGQS